MDSEELIKRAYSYGKTHFSHYAYEEQIERVYEHLVNKYSETGYAKVYLVDDEFDVALIKLRALLSDKNKFIEKAKALTEKE